MLNGVSLTRALRLDRLITSARNKMHARTLDTSEGERERGRERGKQREMKVQHPFDADSEAPHHLIKINDHRVESPKNGQHTADCHVGRFFLPPLCVPGPSLAHWELRVWSFVTPNG